MKRILLSLSLSLLCAGAFAQTIDFTGIDIRTETTKIIHDRVSGVISQVGVGWDMWSDMKNITSTGGTIGLRYFSVKSLGFYAGFDMSMAGFGGNYSGHITKTSKYNYIHTDSTDRTNTFKVDSISDSRRKSFTVSGGVMLRLRKHDAFAWGAFLGGETLGAKVKNYDGWYKYKSTVPFGMELGYYYFHNKLTFGGMATIGSWYSINAAVGYLF
ncbi:MAG: hypothetical protein J5835_04855 [Bacteroidales bacterium]|nr:hypothetical protein [Bacteroidales bacterium]